MTKGFSIMPSTYKVLLSEWGIFGLGKNGFPLWFTGYWGHVLALSGLLAGMCKCGAEARMLSV